MADSFTTSSRTGFFGGIKNAIVGMLLGFVMVPGSIALLSWNEYRTIHRTHGLNEGAELVQTVADPTIASPELAGTLIHLNGKAETEERLRDDVFGIEEQAIRLTRNTEMFQWVEDKKTEKRGNRKETTYTYNLEWESGRENHESFKHPNGHENPMPKFSHAEMEAKQVNLGGYVLNQSLKNSINSHESVAWDDEVIEALPEDIRDYSVVSGQYLYWSLAGVPNPQNPILGDQRISFDVVRPTGVSLVSAVSESSPEQLKPFKTSNGEKLERLYVGSFSAAEVFEKMQGENTMWAWILRAAGFFISFLGFSMIMGVLSAFTDWIPVVGSMTRAIIGFVAFLLAFTLTTLTIAFAWVAVRPMFAIPLIVVGVGAAVMAWRASRKKQEPVPAYASVPQAAAPEMLGSDDVVH